MKNIILSGNKHYGLGKSLFEKFPDASFFSRSNGEFDFSDVQAMEHFAKISLDYDVYISCSYIPYFKQLLLLGKVWKTWTDSNKQGHIIALGSTADWSPKIWLYPTEKKALRDFCRRFGTAASGGGPNVTPGNGVRITYLAPGMLDLPKQREKHGDNIAKLDTTYLSGVIEWLINQPEDVNIYEISMDPVQK